MRSGIVAAALVALTVASACLSTRREPLLAVVQDGKYGFIDHSGRMVIRPQFAWAEDFWQGLGTVYVCGRYVSIDRAGTIVPARPAAPGRLERLTEGQKVGFVDERGRFRIKPLFDEALPFSQGLAAVKLGERWGFIDTDGDLVIRPQFDGLHKPVRHDGVRASVQRGAGRLSDRRRRRRLRADSDVSRFWMVDGRFGYVNTSGRVIWGPTPGSPSHAPLFGWSDEEKAESCQGLSPPVKENVERLFPH